MYNYDEIIEDVIWQQNSINNEKLWISDVSQLQFGKCHTLQNYGQLGVNLELDAAYFKLNPSLPYRLYLHDPSYFFLTANPLAIPQIERAVKVAKNRTSRVQMQYISATKHIAINRPDAPCEEDKDYSFTTCIKKSVVKFAGCKVPWDNDIENIRECRTVDEVVMHISRYINLSISEQQTVFKLTGCKPPCTYLKYVDVAAKGSEWETDNSSLLYILSFATTQVTIKREIYIYPFSSFLAEFGGALGMFLGFSFFMVWDFINWFLVKYIFRNEQCKE